VFSYLFFNFEKIGSIFDVATNEYDMAKISQSYTYSIINTKNSIASGDCFCVKINFHKNFTIEPFIELPFAFYIKDENNRSWIQGFGLDKESINESSRLKDKDFYNYLHMQDAEKAMYDRIYWAKYNIHRDIINGKKIDEKTLRYYNIKSKKAQK
jgi:hypothetical protein